MIRRFVQDESGQAIVEFVLLAAMSIGVVIFLKDSLKRITVLIWVKLAKKIAAPCPIVEVCAPGEEFDI